MTWEEILKASRPLLENLGYTKADGKPDLPNDVLIEIPLLIKKGREVGFVDEFKWEGGHVYYKVIDA